MRSLSKQKNTAPRTGITHGLLHDTRSRSRDYDTIGAAAARHLHNTFQQGRLARVEGSSSPQANGQLAAERHGVGGQQGGSIALHQHGEKQTDGSLSQYYHYILSPRIQLGHALKAGIERLDKTRRVEGNTSRDLFHAALDDPIHDATVL